MAENQLQESIPSELHRPRFWWFLALPLFSLGSMAVVYFVCRYGPVEGRAADEFRHILWGCAGVVVGLLCMWRAVSLDRDASDENRTDAAQFARCRLGLGYALFLTGLLIVTAFVGMSRGGFLHIIYPAIPENSDSQSTSVDEAPASQEGFLDIYTVRVMEPRALRLLLAAGLACFGTLFFLYNSILGMERKAEDDSVETVVFSAKSFWAGTWFRLGEALLFTVLVSVLSFSNLVDPKGEFNEIMLPVVALFMGMFVKSAERLVFGMSERILGMVETLVGPGPPKSPPPQPPPPGAAPPPKP